jgi:hypothetical protein
MRELGELMRQTDAEVLLAVPFHMYTVASIFIHMYLRTGSPDRRHP